MGVRSVQVGLLVATLLWIGALAAAPAGAAPDWTEIDSFPGQILDVDSERVLFEQADGGLAVEDRATETTTTIPLAAGMVPYGGFLSPHGAVVALAEPPSNTGAVYEWRDGSLIRLGPARVLSLEVAGSFAIWQDQADLYRRDLNAGTTAKIAPNASSSGSHDFVWQALRGSDVAANGDVAMWRFDGIYRYRAGVTERMDAPLDPSVSGYPAYPRTDGTNVVWRTWTCCDPPRGSLRGTGPNGPFTLDEFTSSFAAKEPVPDSDYRVNGGWVAFTRGEPSVERVWTRSPAGVETPVSPAGGYEIAGLSSTGEVVYGTYDEGWHNVTSFLARPGEAPVAIGPTVDDRRDGRGYMNHVIPAGGRWYSIVGGSLRRLQLGDEPIGGSQTSIDSGPEGTDPDPTPTFEFSSTVAGATFQCRLDGGGWTACDPTTTLPSLADGPHVLLVRSVAPDGAVDPEPASQAWTVEAPPPGAFSLLDPAGGVATSDATPAFAWGAASGADHYAVFVDGDRFETAATQLTPAAPLPDGAHTWHVDAVDASGRTRSSAARTFTVDTSAPSASLRASPNPALTGDPVSLDASGSADPGGTIVRYEWDLDGDGAFDRDTGASASTATGYPSRREIRPAVRVTDAAGNAATASAAVSVRQAPPAGPAGVSIDGGARFTNDRDVTVRVVWPAFATSVLLSNDGGFGGAGSFPVEPELRWRIDPAGSGRLPRTIYARFAGIDGARETYQDDIVLDETRPRVILAEVTARAKRTYRLRIRGRDAVSGVKRMQIAANGRKPGPILRYRNSATFTAASSKVLVRVRDGAGNWSRWRRAGR